MKEKINKIIEYVKSNKKVFMITAASIVIVSVLIIILTILFDKDTIAVTDTEDSLTINCPESARAGEEIECSIVLNAMTINVQGLSASYSISEGMEFVSFTKSDNWSNYVEGSSDGFVLVDFNGVSGSNVIGSLKYKLPETAKSNEIYKVELVNATIGDGGDISIAFEDVYSETRIMSDINTLSSINVTNGTLDQTFDPDVNLYSTTINSDKVTIEVNVTDENSVVSGDIGELSLHYGTNEFSIIVTSESGKENTYVLKVYRPYEFSTDNYIYSSTDNYIYTGTDVDTTTILSNIVLPSELTASIEDNKLNIKYGDEKLLEINILNIKSTKYTELDGILYIENNLNYNDFMSTFILNGVNSKIYDSNNNEITDGIINETYKFKIYFNDTLLEEYTFKKEYLNIDNLIVDDTNKIIKRVVINTTYGSLLSNITTTGSITVKDKDNKILNESAKVKTGDTIEIKLNGGTLKYTVSVLGDINGTGTIDVGDVTLLYRHLKGKAQLELYQVSAGDTINNGSIKVNDVSRIYRYHKGKITSVEVE